MRKFRLSRPVNIYECPWLNADMPEGMEVYERADQWGCCSPDGIAVSFSPYGSYFEVPVDAVVESWSAFNYSLN